MLPTHDSQLILIIWKFFTILSYLIPLCKTMTLAHMGVIRAQLVLIAHLLKSGQMSPIRTSHRSSEQSFWALTHPCPGHPLPTTSQVKIHNGSSTSSRSSSLCHGYHFGCLRSPYRCFSPLQSELQSERSPVRFRRGGGSLYWTHCEFILWNDDPCLSVGGELPAIF